LSSTLVVGPSWVGDMIMAQTLFKRLKSQKPDQQIDVLAPRASLPMASRMAEVSGIFEFNVRHGELGLAYRRSVAKKLSAGGYDRAIVLPNSLKSALVPFFAGIPTRTGFRGEYRYGLINDMRLLDKRRMPRMIDRFAALAVLDSSENKPPVFSEYPELKVDFDQRERLLDQFNLRTQRPVVGLCPGAEFGEAKRWPEQHYAALAAKLVEKGADVWIFGGKADEPIGQAVVDFASLTARNHIADLTGKTSLIDVVDIMGQCACVVSNDSGLMHVSAAIGCHTIVLYGSTSPNFTPPLTERVDIANLSLDCSPCFKRTCPLGHMDCLNKLNPAQVLALVTPIIEAS